MTDTIDQERAKIVEVAERWKRQYSTNGHWRELLVASARSTVETHAKILACKTLDQVDLIIGNKSWTHNRCSSCSTQTRKKMANFDVNDGEYDYSICATCLRAALDELSEE